MCLDESVQTGLSHQAFCVSPAQYETIWKPVVQILRNSNEENFSKFWYGDWPSLPLWARGKQKKEEQQRFECFDVIELDDLVEGAQAKTTKYPKTFFKIVFALNYCNKILKITFCFLEKMHSKIKRKLYATDCECFKSNFTRYRLSHFGCQMFKQWPLKLGIMYQTAHQNDGFNALRLYYSKRNPACSCYDSKPAKLHKARWAIQLLNHLLGCQIGQVRVNFKSDQAQWHSSWRSFITES